MPGVYYWRVAEDTCLIVQPGCRTIRSYLALTGDKTELSAMLKITPLAEDMS